MRRYLTLEEIEESLHREKPVEQFLGQVPDMDFPTIRSLQIRSHQGCFQLWLYDQEDVGDEDFTDLVAFPFLDPDSEYEPKAVLATLAEALDFSSSEFSASPACWVVEPISHSEYLDYVKADRPLVWPCRS